jgi:hypothetical protein
LVLLQEESELDLSLRGGVVVQFRLALRRRVGVSGPGVEMAMLDFDLLDGVAFEQVMMA